MEIADDWGAGHVELVQIPTHNEYNDNMNAYWVPEKTPQAGDTLNFSYRLHWHWAKKRPVPLGYVTDTRLMREEKLVRFIIDFRGKDLNVLSSKNVLEADITVSKGYKILNHQIIKNVATDGWRLVFQLQMDHEGLLKDILHSKRPAGELLAFLKVKGKPVTETWTYTLVP